MKRLFCLLLILIAGNALCRTISLRGFYNRNIHLKYETSSDVNIPEEFQSTAQVPGIGQFYDSSHGFNMELCYYPKSKSKDLNLLLIGGFSNQKIKSNVEIADFVFGKSINISKVYFNIGSGRHITANKKNAYLYFALGPVLNFYKGETEYEDWKLVFDYKPSISFRLNSGIEIPLEKFFFINFSICYDIGNIGRSNLNYYLNDGWVAKARPTGESEINDDQLILSIGITWDHELRRKK